MNVEGRTVFLDGNEVAIAIDAYLVAHRVNISGPRTIRITAMDHRNLCGDIEAEVYVDPSGKLADNRER